MKKKKSIFGEWYNVVLNNDDLLLTYFLLISFSLDIEEEDAKEQKEGTEYFKNLLVDVSYDLYHYLSKVETC